MTALDLIKGSLRLIGAIAAGEEPNNAEAQDALASLNSLIESWQNDRLMVYAVLPQTFTLVPGKWAYTLGPKGDFDTPRPVKIEKCSLLYGNGPQQLNLPVRLVDVDEYNRFIVPEVQSPIPTALYVDSNFPLRTLHFYPVPSTTNQVQLYTWQPVEEFAALTTVLALPPGYERAMRYALACELAPEYGVDPIPEAVVYGAKSARAKLKSINAPSPLLNTDPALHSGGGFNYLTGE